MSNLKIPVTLHEVMNTYEDVEDAFLKRGYTIDFDRERSPFVFKATIVNFLDEEINYEFTGKDLQRTYQQAAFFLMEVENTRRSFGLPQYDKKGGDNDA